MPFLDPSEEKAARHLEILSECAKFFSFARVRSRVKNKDVFGKSQIYDSIKYNNKIS